MPLRRFLLFMLLLLLSSFLMLAGCTVGSPEDRVRTELITVVVVVSPTPDPNATPNVIIITATTDRTQIAVPDNIVPQGTRDANNALNLTALPLDLTQSSSSSGSAAPDGCLTHIVGDGDTMFGLADEYGVNPFVMLEVNGMTEETAFLNIGDELIVPIEGCPIEQIIVSQVSSDDGTQAIEVTEEITAEATESANTTPTVTPTITLAPTATDSEIEIVGIVRAGDVTAEGVRIRNNGRVVNVTGWILSDADGNSYTFPDQMIFSNAELTLYTRTGQDVPVSRFWGLQTAVWQVGDVVTLTDADGDVQAIYRVPENP